MATSEVCQSLELGPQPPDGDSDLVAFWGRAPSRLESSEVLSKNLQAGPIFTCQSNPDMPGLLHGSRMVALCAHTNPLTGPRMCFGGKCPVMWDLSSGLGSQFAARFRALQSCLFRLEGLESKIAMAEVSRSCLIASSSTASKPHEKWQLRVPASHGNDLEKSFLWKSPNFS